VAPNNFLFPKLKLKFKGNRSMIFWKFNKNLRMQFNRLRNSGCRSASSYGRITGHAFTSQGNNSEEATLKQPVNLTLFGF
jgi:hypothetical protein